MTEKGVFLHTGRHADMDPNTLLPTSVGLKTSEDAYKGSVAAVAHLMPFSIDYTGPAPVDTYFVMQNASESSNNNGCSDQEAVSAFRGRKVFGTRLDLPESYRLGFFHKQKDPVDDHGEETISNKIRGSRTTTKQAVPPAPVRGSRFTLDDDEEEQDAQELENFEMSEPPTTVTKDSVEAQSACKLSNTGHSLYPVASMDRSLWVWGPDGPIDQGDDEYIRTCREWLGVIAPAVCVFFTQLHGTV